MSNPTATKTLDVEDPGNLLALIASTFGYTPSDSLVIIGLQGPKTGGFLRVDLGPAMMNPGKFVAEYSRYFAPAHDACIVAILTDREPAPEDPTGQVAGGAVVMEGMAHVGVPAVSAWQFGGGYAHALDCTDAECCSYPGLPAVVLSEVGQELMPETEVTPAEEVQAFVQANAVPGFAAEVATAEISIDEGIHLWGEIISGEMHSRQVSPRGMAGLTQLLTGTGPKALIATAAADLRTGYSELAQDDSPTPAVAEATGPAPDWKRLDRLAEALADVSDYATDAGKAGAYAVMSWISWAKGKGSVHALFTEQALTADPGNELAHALEGQHEGPSGWQQSKSTAYKSRT